MLKLTFELYPEDGRIKPYGHPYGYIFRGVIMKWLSDIKPELVHKLHEFEKSGHIPLIISSIKRFLSLTLSSFLTMMRYKMHYFKI